MAEESSTPTQGLGLEDVRVEELSKFDIVQDKGLVVKIEPDGDGDHVVIGFGSERQRGTPHVEHSDRLKKDERVTRFRLVPSED